jgi:hypothetical protein
VALVGSGVPAGIGGRLGVREHEQGPGKLARGSARTNGAREQLPTAARGHRNGGRKGGSGARVSGRCAAQLKRRTERLRAGEAHEQGIRGPEGVLGPCHGGGEVSIDRELKGAVALVEESVRGEEQARGKKEATRGGRGNRRWTPAACTAAAGGAAPAAVRSRAGEAEK